jgi:hypothetical protein
MGKNTIFSRYDEKEDAGVGFLHGAASNPSL